MSALSYKQRVFVCVYMYVCMLFIDVLFGIYGVLLKGHYGSLWRKHKPSCMQVSLIYELFTLRFPKRHALCPAMLT